MGTMQKRARMVRERYREELGYLPSRREAGRLASRDFMRRLLLFADFVPKALAAISAIKAARAEPIVAKDVTSVCTVNLADKPTEFDFAAMVAKINAEAGRTVLSTN